MPPEQKGESLKGEHAVSKRDAMPPMPPSQSNSRERSPSNQPILRGIFMLRGQTRCGTTLNNRRHHGYGTKDVIWTHHHGGQDGGKERRKVTVAENYASPALPPPAMTKKCRLLFVEMFRGRRTARIDAASTCNNVESGVWNF